MFGMRRREFVSAARRAAAAWPLAARAQQGERMRRVGVLVGSGTDADDYDMQARFAAFAQALQQLGWTDGRNVRIDYRYASGDPERIRRYAAELVALAPDVIVTGGAAAVTAGVAGDPHRTDRVYDVVDPVGAGFVESLARPGGNATGFIMLEYSQSAKWLELLKEIAPSVTRVAVLRDPAHARRHRPVRRDRVGGAIAAGGGEPGQRSRPPARSSAPWRRSPRPRTAV